MELTEDQKTAYIAASGTRCPICGDPDIEGDHVEIDAGRATQTVSCVGCGADWVDCYVLKSVRAMGLCDHFGDRS